MSAYLLFVGTTVVAAFNFWLWRCSGSLLSKASTIIAILGAAFWGLVFVANPSAGCTTWAPSERGILTIPVDDEL